MARQQVIQILVNCDVCGFDAKGQSKCADIKAGKPLVEVYKVTPPSEEARPVLGEDGKPLMQEDGKTPQVQLITHPMKVARLDVCAAKAAPYTAAQEAYKEFDGEDVTPATPTNGNSPSGNGEKKKYGKDKPNVRNRAIRWYALNMLGKDTGNRGRIDPEIIAAFERAPMAVAWQTHTDDHTPAPGWNEDGSKQGI